MNWSPVRVNPLSLSVAEESRSNFPLSPCWRSDVLLACGLAFSRRSEGEDGPMTVTSKPISEWGVVELRRAADCGLILSHQSNGRFEGAFLTLLVPSVSMSEVVDAYLAVVPILFITLHVSSLIMLLHLVFLNSPQVK